jgi:DNA-binding transcriptional LysR family regulator
LEFKRIVELGSITAASQHLHVPRATLSRRLSQLEEDLGVRLLQRSTRQLALTAAGEELYVRARRIVTDTHAAWDAVATRGGRPQGPLRVAVPDAEMAQNAFFLDFARAFPEVSLEVVVRTGVLDLRAERIDVALMFGHVEDASLIARRLWLSRRYCMASPAYLEREGAPQTLEDLSSRRCVVYENTRGVPELRWPTKDGGFVDVLPGFTTNSWRMLVKAVREGIGIGFIGVGGASGRSETEFGLVRLFPDDIEMVAPFSLVYVERDLLLPHVRSFIERARDYWGSWDP